MSVGCWVSGSYILPPGTTTQNEVVCYEIVPLVAKILRINQRKYSNLCQVLHFAINFKK